MSFSFLQRLTLDLELDDAPLHLVDLLGKAVDLDAKPARRLVHEVDRLVGEESVADVPVREGGSGHQRVVGDPHAVMHLVLLLEPPENRDRVGHARLAHQYRLEATLERGVLLDVLAIFIEGRRPDHMQLAPRKRRLEHIGGVHRPFRRAGAHDRMQLIDERDVLALALGELLHHGLEPLFELASILGAGKQQTDVECHQLALAQ